MPENRGYAEGRRAELNRTELTDTPRLLVIGLMGLISAALDIADAVREHTAALTGDDKRAVLVERSQ